MMFADKTIDAQLFVSYFYIGCSRIDDIRCINQSQTFLSPREPYKTMHNDCHY